MPIDSSILQGVKPVKDPLEQYTNFLAAQGAISTNASNNQKVAEGEREIANLNALNTAFKGRTVNGVTDYKGVYNDLAAGDRGSAIGPLQKSRADIDKVNADAEKTRFETISAKIKRIKDQLGGVRTPDHALALHEQIYADPETNSFLTAIGASEPEERARLAAAAQAGPAVFAQYIADEQRGALGVEKALQQHFDSQNLGGSVRTIAMPAFGGGPAREVAGSRATVTPSPNRPQSTVKVVMPAAEKGDTAFAEESNKLMAREYDALKGASRDMGELIRTSHRVRDILDKGVAITGFAAEGRLNLERLVELAGAGNKEAITATNTLKSNLKRLALNAIRTSGLGTGNGFTTKDMENLELAKSGTITLDDDSIRNILDLAEEEAQRIISQFNSRGAEIKATGLGGKAFSFTPIQVPKRGTGGTWVPGQPIPKEAIEYLRNNPGAADHFERDFKLPKGGSAKYLPRHP